MQFAINLIALTSPIQSKTPKRSDDPEYMDWLKRFGIKKCRCQILRDCKHQTYCIYCKSGCGRIQTEHLNARCSIQTLPDMTRWNEFPCCSTCNQSKGKKTVEEWLDTETGKSLKGRGKSQIFIDKLRRDIADFRKFYEEQRGGKPTEKQLQILREFHSDIDREWQRFVETIKQKAEITKQRLFANNDYNYPTFMFANEQKLAVKQWNNFEPVGKGHTIHTIWHSCSQY